MSWLPPPLASKNCFSTVSASEKTHVVSHLTEWEYKKYKKYTKIIWMGSQGQETRKFGHGKAIIAAHAMAPKRRRCFHGSFCREACGILVHIDWMNWMCVFVVSAERCKGTSRTWVNVNVHFWIFLIIFLRPEDVQQVDAKADKAEAHEDGLELHCGITFSSANFGRGWEERQQFWHGRGSWSPQHVMSLFVGGKPIQIVDRSTSWKHRKLAGFCLLHWVFQKWIVFCGGGLPCHETLWGQLGCFANQLGA